MDGEDAVQSRTQHHGNASDFLVKGEPPASALPLVGIRSDELSGLRMMPSLVIYCPTGLRNSQLSIRPDGTDPVDFRKPRHH